MTHVDENHKGARGQESLTDKEVSIGNRSTKNAAVLLITKGARFKIAQISHVSHFSEDKLQQKCSDSRCIKQSIRLHYGLYLPLSGRPLLNGHISKSLNFCNVNTITYLSIKRPPLLSGRGHPTSCPNDIFL